MTDDRELDRHGEPWQEDNGQDRPSEEQEFKESDLSPKMLAAVENCRMYLETLEDNRFLRSPLYKKMLFSIFAEDQDRPIDEPIIYPDCPKYNVTDIRLQIPDISMKMP